MKHYLKCGYTKEVFPCTEEELKVAWGLLYHAFELRVLRETVSFEDRKQRILTYRQEQLSKKIDKLLEE